jgi:4-hydroxy-tetrahydrodipicolinate synthase
VLAGATAAWAKPTADRVAAAVQAGADAVLVAPPRRPGDLAGFYTAVAEAAGTTPVLAYHFPGVVGGEVPVEALAGLPISGIKDSTGNPERLLRTLEAWAGWTYVGSSTVVGYAGLLGATGAILAVANAVPEDCVAAFDVDAPAQRRLIGPHLAARDRFPHGLKELVAQRFGTLTGCRLG